MQNRSKYLTALIISISMIIFVVIDLVEPKPALPTIEPALKKIEYTSADAKVVVPAWVFTLQKGRDPLQIPDAILKMLIKADVSSVKKSSDGKLVFQGVFHTQGEKPKAIISGRIVEEGDFIGTAQVVAIGKGSVKMLVGEKEILLSLHE